MAKQDFIPAGAPTPPGNNVATRGRDFIPASDPTPALDVPPDPRTPKPRTPKPAPRKRRAAKPKPKAPKVVPIADAPDVAEPKPKKE